MAEKMTLASMDTVRAIRDAVTAHTATAEAVLDETIRRIGRRDGAVHAFLSVEADFARAAARAVDEKIQRGENPGPLAGVPVAVKDNICIRGNRVGCASKILDNFRPPYHATVIERVLAAGAVPLGRTNMDEFAMGSSTEHSAFGATRNPWDTTRIPGGSSGGSAAAVAARMVPAALGSDTGGSIRQPAALCGVTGFKPTYGTVSRYGLIAFASSLDQIGPFATDADGAALIFDVMAGHDARDSTSVPDGRLASAAGGDVVKGLRIGLPAEYFGEGLDPDVKRVVLAAVETLKSLGAVTVPVSLPHSPYAVATYYIVATAEASSNLARYDGVHYGHRTNIPGDLIAMVSRSRAEGFGAEVKRRIMLGTYALSSGYYDAYYKRALQVRQRILEDFQKAFAAADVIASPTSPTTAFRAGERMEDPLAMYLSDIYTISANLAGIPGISVPCGRDGRGLPVGLQFMGRAFEDRRLLAVAAAYAKAAGHEAVQPPVATLT
ncbi:MAG: Asp-tRNA(Asn)/Glu-tRNA(Gln) amidotransferase subunit GatA [Planctomycetota bacterium]